MNSRVNNYLRVVLHLIGLVVLVAFNVQAQTRGKGLLITESQHKTKLVR